MLDTDAKKELHERLIEFAKKHPRVKAVFKGTNPESCGKDNYHFLTGRDCKFNGKFEDEVTELNINLVNNILQKTENVSIDVWPINPEQAEDYFSGNFIYKG